MRECRETRVEGRLRACPTERVDVKEGWGSMFWLLVAIAVVVVVGILISIIVVATYGYPPDLP